MYDCIRIDTGRKMSCLLPQFKCLPDTFSFHSKTHLQPTTQLSKSKETVFLRTQCILSTTAPPPTTATATVLDMEKLRLLSLEAHSNTATADRPWMYMGTIGPPTEVNFGASLATETLLTSEEATIAAAAAEAVALAKAAVRIANEAAMLVSPSSSKKLRDKPAVIQSEDDTFLFDRAQQTQMRQVALAGESAAVATGLNVNFPLEYPSEEDLEETSEELELFQATVRSRRQSERKAIRARAAEKAANMVYVKPGSTSRKNRSSRVTEYYDPFNFSRTTAKSRLLTTAEEKEFSLGIQDLLKLETLQEELAERCGSQPTLAQWAAAAGVDELTMRKRVNYGVQCKDKMIKSNIRLVISIAKNFQGTVLDIQDLVQAGVRGLVRAAEKFDSTRGFKFSTYAHWWIRQAVQRCISMHCRTIRLPFHMVEASYKVKEAKKNLYSKYGRYPSNEQLAAATGLSMRRLRSVLLLPKAPLSLDDKIGVDMNMKRSDVIADPNAESAEKMMIKECMKLDLEKVLKTLTPREEHVIRWRFGLEDGRTKTLQEIGELMGVSRERIRQIESCAFRKLKNKRRVEHFMRYVIELMRSDHF